MKHFSGTRIMHRYRRGRTRFLWASAVIAVIAGLLGAACHRPRVDRPNIILISIDTLRADHLGPYGYKPPTSPSLEAFRKDAILFSTAIAQAPSTLPSHASIFTSLIPQHHRASHTHKVPLAPEAVTLAEVLKDAGYHTLAVTGGAQLDPTFGVSQGFDEYEVHDDWKFRDAVNRGLELLSSPIKDHDQKPFFLFLHTYEVHHPYTPDRDRLRMFDGGYSGSLPGQISIELLQEVNHGTREIDQNDLKHIMAAYDAEIRSVDDAFGDLLRRLRQRDLYKDTMIVFTADHGEEFGEHGFVGWHAHTLFDELIHVPLLVKMPGLRYAGSEVETPVQGIDVAPTILAGAGLEPPAVFEGLTLLPFVAQPPTIIRPTVVWRETSPQESGVKWGVRTPRWKLHEGRLFDLSQDPLEHHDLAATFPEVVAQLRQDAERILAQRSPLPMYPLRLDDPTRKTLRALGYIN